MERLVACALIRNSVTESRGFKEHWQIRAALGDEDPYKSNGTDEEGFWTSEERFVSRHEAAEIGLVSGQVSAVGRKLLSSDIHWDGQPPKQLGSYPKKKRLFRP